ncbi:MAG: D-alanine--D-alanine ligase [Ruminococcaceae bacterium]|nr:D-alanine--D-alanine ligase [Oscillospiraceae bacterium]
MKIKLAVLFGGESSEHEVSLVSASAVIDNIDRDVIDPVMIGITRSGEWYLYDGTTEDIRNGAWQNGACGRITLDLAGGGLCADGKHLDVDAVFPVLHGAFGEDGTVQGMLELAKIPVVGCGSASSAVCMDKAFTKRLLNAEGIPQAPAAIITYEEYSTDAEDSLDYAEEGAEGYPIFVKPARTGSSVGVSKADDREELRTAMDIAFREDSKVLCEKCIVGREVEVAVLRDADGTLTVSECGEIDPGSEFYDYDTKYKSDTAAYFIPARIPEDIAEDVRATAEIVFRLLDCRGLSRVDFFVTDEGFVFNEINTLPGCTPISMYPKMMEHSGVGFSELITRLVREAMARG